MSSRHVWPGLSHLLSQGRKSLSFSPRSPPTISTALDSIRSRRSELESQMAALRVEHDKLQTAEQALAELVIGEQYASNRSLDALTVLRSI